MALDATDESSEPAEESVEDETDETKETKAEGSEETSEEVVDPKDAVIGGYRRKARDLEIENARLQGEVAARKDMVSAHAYAKKFHSLDLAFQNMFPEVLQRTKDEIRAQLTTRIGQVE